MVLYYIGDGATNGGSDLNSGSREVTVVLALSGELLSPLVLDRVVLVTPQLEHWMDGGDFGSAYPQNARLKHDTVLTGELKLTVAGPSPLVAAASAVTGSFLVNAVVTDKSVTAAPVVVGVGRLTLFFSRPVLAVGVAVLGDLPRDSFLDLTPDVFAIQDGIRPSTPWLIYYDQIEHHGFVVVDGIFQIAVNEPFLVSVLFQEAHDTVFADMGARANRIGMVLQEGLVQALRFRDPFPNEVIVFKDTCELRRWDDDAGVWKAYTTPPQRGLDGQMVFQVLDEEEVYDYYAKICGLAQTQWSFDTKRIGDFVDPVTVSDDFASLLADNFGLRVLNETDPDRKREFIRQYIQIEKGKGTDASFRNALRMLGYSGYANNIWVIPGGDSTKDYIEKPIGYDSDAPTTYFPASQVSIHLNDLSGDRLQVIDEGVKQTVAEFLVLNVLPAHVRIRTFITDFGVTTDAEAVSVSDSINITVV